MRTWQLQDAKARLSEVIKEAALHGPQEITLRGEPAVVVISKKEYCRLIKPKPSFVQFMQQSPLAQIELDLERDASLSREDNPL